MYVCTCVGTCCKSFRGIKNGVEGKHYYLVEQEELVNAYQLINETVDQLQMPSEFEGNTSTGGFSVQSLSIPHHDHNGVLYRTNEYVYARHYSKSVVLKIVKIFSLNINETYYIFVSESKYLQESIHSVSGNAIVKVTETFLMVRGQDILRKVMLYPNETTDNFIVIDFGRPNFPLSPEDVLVPQFSEPDDIVSVSGEDGQTWLAHVQSSNPFSKSCQVYFYVSHENNNKLYHKERNRLERVHWNCMFQDMYSGRTTVSFYLMISYIKSNQTLMSYYIIIPGESYYIPLILLLVLF